MYLSIDLGTGSVKCLLVGREGETLGKASAACPPRTPAAGLSEADVGDWWAAVRKAVRSTVGSDTGTVQAIGLSGQMHGAVGVDADGAVVRPPILWPDTRSTHALDAYRALDVPMLDRLANPPAVGMAGASMVWLAEHEPATMDRTAFWIQPKDWLRARLVEQVRSEHSDASSTLLYDVAAQDWAYDIVDSLGLDPATLAPLLESAELAGGVTALAARDLGLPEGTPVAAGGADAACALLGNGTLPSRAAQLTVGSGATISVLRDEPVADRTRRTHLFRSVERDRWYAMAAMQNVGLALDWVRRLFGLDWSEVYGTLDASEPGARGVTFLPYLSGERTPHVDAFAEGAWVGLRAHHDQADVVRAALEGCALAIRDGLDALIDAGNTIELLRLAGGGSVDQRWRQLLADVLEVPIAATPVVEASAFGAARLAARAIGEELRSPGDGVQELVAAPSEHARDFAPILERYRAAYQGLRLGDGGASPLDVSTA